jgi:hypothetical protein
MLAGFKESDAYPYEAAPKKVLTLPTVLGRKRKPFNLVR